MRRAMAITGAAGVVLILSGGSSIGGGRQVSTMKNITVLTGFTDEHVNDTMFYIRGSLGVQCEHCHDEKDWSSDVKEAKAAARRMIRMVRTLNRELGDELAVSCYSCHRGQLRPVTTVPLLTERPVAPVTIVTPTPASKALTADGVLKRFLAASGGDAWSRLTTRVAHGRLITSEPAVYPAEAYYRAPDLLRTQIIVDRQPFTKVFDGTSGWSIDNRGATAAHGEELDRLRRQAALALPLALPRLYPALSVEGESVVGGEPVAVLVTTSADRPRERLFFGLKSGLLVRIETSTASPLGALPRRWDYEDYRKVNGVRVPFKVRETDPDYTYLWEFSSIRQNVWVDDRLFRQ